MKQRAHVKSGQAGSATFTRFMRSLDADGFQTSILGIAIVALLLTGWGAWFFMATLPVYEVTTQARLEVERAIHPIEALVTGRVVQTRLAVGRVVQAGEVLVEIDTDVQEAQLEEERTRAASIGPQLETLSGEVAAEGQALAHSWDASRAGMEEARAKFQEAEAAARFAEVEAERLARLHAEGLVAEVDLLRARADAKRRQATADSLSISVRRLEREQVTQESDRTAKLERLKHESSRLAGEKRTHEAAIHRISNEIEKRRILAPASGPLGQVRELRVGAVVREGDQLGAVVPPGKLRVVAEFAPSAALGRVRPGQPARLRLEGFPWSQYGSIPAVVTTVAGEVREGRVRVELEARPEPTSQIPLQHGLPGAVEVEVERITAANLVLRAAGKLVASPTVGNGVGISK